VEVWVVGGHVKDSGLALVGRAPAAWRGLYV